MMTKTNNVTATDAQVTVSERDIPRLRKNLEALKAKREAQSEEDKRLQRDLGYAQTRLTATNNELTETHALLKYGLGVKNVSIL